MTPNHRSGTETIDPSTKQYNTKFAAGRNPSAPISAPPRNSCYNAPMTSAIRIRRAAPADAGFIAAANAAMALESEGRALDADTLRAGVTAVLADAALGFYLLAEIDGQPAGQLMVTFEWSDWRNGLFWWIQSVYVCPQFRRQGVYRTLHQYVQSAAQAADNVCGLRLYVEVDNAIAQAVYREMGMSPTRYYIYETEF